MKNIIITGGGSAGHVTPNLAIIPLLRENGYCIHYMGMKKGYEYDLVHSEEGVVYHAIKSGKLRRYHSRDNWLDPFRVLFGIFQSWIIIHKVKPVILFSKGGYVAVPAVIGAWLNRVPVICHESDVSPGLANRISIRLAKKVAVTFPECMEKIGTKAVLTGTPMRDSLMQGSRLKGLHIMGADGSKPVLLMVGGSQGAKSINTVLREALPQITTEFFVFHICGKGNLDNSFTNTSDYTQTEYLTTQLPDILAAADIVLSRAGSNSICELHALLKPMLLIPYPKLASRGDQIENALSLQKRGICHVLFQENLNVSNLIDSLHTLYDDRDNLVENMKKHPAAQGVRQIIDLIQAYERKIA